MALEPGMSDEHVQQILHEATKPVVLPPHKLHLAQDAQIPVLSTAGWPTGNHHPLVKASEARLAVQSGAHGVLAVLDQSADEAHYVSELAILIEAVPEPAGLWVVLGEAIPEHNREIFAQRARLMGVRGVISALPWPGCGTVRGDRIELS